MVVDAKNIDLSVFLNDLLKNNAILVVNKSDLGIDEMVNQLMQKSNGVHAEAGFHDVVLDADLAGILAHEAIGHTTEADLVMGGSVAKDYLNEMVANELVS